MFRRSLSPRSGDSAVARFAGSMRIYSKRTWGWRPRLYAVARFAGYA